MLRSKPHRSAAPLLALLLFASAVSAPAQTRATAAFSSRHQASRKGPTASNTIQGNKRNWNRLSIVCHLSLFDPAGANAGPPGNAQRPLLQYRARG